jgi:hypothetical protein
MKPRPPSDGNAHPEGPGREPRPLLTVRSALILLLASLSAIGAGCLLYAAHHSFALAVLGGAAAFAAAVPLFNSVID